MRTPYKNNYILFFILVMFHISSLSYAQPVSSSEKRNDIYQFGVFAYRGEERTRHEFEPIIDAINKTLSNSRIELQILTQDEIYTALENGTLDFISTNPTHFLVARYRFDVSGALATLVKNNEGTPLDSLAGVIITRNENSSINSLNDLRGKKIAAPGPEFLGGYRAQLYELYLAGIRLKDENVHFTGSHRKTVDAVLEGQADVGFIRDGTIEALEKHGVIDTQQLKVINAQYRPNFPHTISTHLYPEWPVFALPHVSNQAKRQITAAMLSLNVNEFNSEDSALYGFTVPADYLGVESLSRALRIAPFETIDRITWHDLNHQYGAAIKWIVGLGIALLLALFGVMMVFKRSLAAKLYSQELLACQDEIVLISDGEKLIDASGGFLTFFNGHYRSVQDFLHDYQCICDLFIEKDGYLYNTEKVNWIVTIYQHPEKTHKAIVFFEGQFTYFKCHAVYSETLHLYVVTLVNITELEYANHQLHEKTYLAEQANQSKSHFLANMSHEIRTPMNGILGLSELGLTEYNVSKLHERLRKIHYSGSILLSLMNDILDLSKIDAGRLNLNPQPFNLSDLLQQVVELYESQAQTKGIQLRCQISQTLAKGYVADDLRLRQILTNLVSNAIKFTKKGTVLLRVSHVNEYNHSTDDADNTIWIRFEIEDTGIGITLAQQQCLFENFIQADDSITREHGGTGLGLTISDKLVKLMGGERINLQSEYHQGSVFSFSLPFQALNPEQLVHIGKAQIQRHTQCDSAPQFNAAVLLVDDNQINQEVTCDQLKRMGIRVDTANNGEIAVLKVQSNHYNLILMDIQMPIMDGYQATHLIRKFNADVPIIALTAAAMLEDKENAIQAGMNGHLSKPISQTNLILTLSNWLDPLVKSPSVFLIVHPDRKILKDLAQQYEKRGCVKVAITTEKADEILTLQPDVDQVLVASEFSETALMWKAHYQVEIIYV